MRPTADTDQVERGGHSEAVSSAPVERNGQTVPETARRRLSVWTCDACGGSWRRLVRLGLASPAARCGVCGGWLALYLPDPARAAGVCGAGQATGYGVQAGQGAGGGLGLKATPHAGQGQGAGSATPGVSNP